MAISSSDEFNKRHNQSSCKNSLLNLEETFESGNQDGFSSTSLVMAFGFGAGMVFMVDFLRKRSQAAKNESEFVEIVHM